jgi:hypothetical protein
VPNIPSETRGLADENKKFLTEWKSTKKNQPINFLKNNFMNIPIKIGSQLA